MRSQRFAVLVGDGNSDSTSVRSVAEKFVSSPVEGIIALEDAMEIFVEANREIDRKIVTPAPSPLKEPLEINNDFYGKSDDYICDNLDWDNLDGDVFV